MALAHLDHGIITETELNNVKHNAVKVFLYAGNNGSSSDILRCKDLPKQLKIVSVVINQSWLGIEVLIKGREQSQKFKVIEGFKVNQISIKDQR